MDLQEIYETTLIIRDLSCYYPQQDNQNRFFHLRLMDFDVIVDTKTCLINISKFLMSLTSNTRLFYNYYNKDSKRLANIISYYSFIECNLPTAIYHWRDVYSSRNNSPLLFLSSAYMELTGAYVYYSIIYDVTMWFDKSLKPKIKQLLRGIFHFINVTNNNVLLINSNYIEVNFDNMIFNDSISENIKIITIYEFLLTTSHFSITPEENVTNGIKLLKAHLNDITHMPNKIFGTRLVLIALFKFCFPNEKFTFTPIELKNNTKDVYFKLNKSNIILSVNATSNLKDKYNSIIFNISHVYKHRLLLKKLLTKTY